MSIPIVIFDGECGLCNRLVHLLIRADRCGVFRICGGDSDVGRLLIAKTELPPDITRRSVVVVRGEQAWTYSSAVLLVASQLSFPWSLLAVGHVFPRSLRDAAYRVVARHRRKLKDADPSCGVPPSRLREEWMSRVVSTPEALEELEKVEEFSFEINERFRPLLWLWGVDAKSAFVRIDTDCLLARFGPFWVKTDLTNIASAKITGPYRWYRAVGVRGSWVDRGLTFGGTARGGVCIRFRTPVSGLGRKLRHPGLTVTVQDGERFAELLGRFASDQGRSEE